MSRPTRDEWALSLAQLTSKRSTCCRRQVGCVLVNHRGHVLATGYNGRAAGLPHCNDFDGSVYGLADDPGYETRESPRRPAITHEMMYPNACPGAKSPSGTNLDGCEAIHAEQNALLQCGDVYQIQTCYVTASPCLTCVKLLLNTSCQRIVFSERYTHGQSEKLWVEAGRAWIYVEDTPFGPIEHVS